MSIYQLFIILHGLKDVLVWLAPLLIAVLFSATAFAISARWMRESKRRIALIEELGSRIESVEARISALEGGAQATRAGLDPHERSIE